MTANKGAKLKLFEIRRMLENETDAEHGISMAGILERLAERGIDAERKSIYRDIELLRESGLDIRTYQRKPVEYALAKRSFDLSELMLIADAVGSSRFLTREQSDELIGKVKQLASERQRALLDRRIHVVGRGDARTEGVFAAIDRIHEAMLRSPRRKISFLYYRVGPDGERRPTHDEPHAMTPLKITYESGFYYLTCWNDKYEDLTEFRVDRMGDIEVLDEAGTWRPEFQDIERQMDERSYFGRFNGKRQRVTLVAKGEKAEILIDRFGRDAVAFQKNGTAKAYVDVRVSQQFFGWLAGLGGVVTIGAPKAVRLEYRSYLEGLLAEGSDAEGASPDA